MRKTLAAILLIFLHIFAGTASGVFLEEDNNLITLRSDNESISNILETLSRRYSIEIDYGDNIFSKSISTTIQKQPLDRIISRLLQMTDNRNFIIYYDSNGNIKKIRFFKQEIAETEKVHTEINQRTYRRIRPKKLPPVTTPNLPEPPEEIEEDSNQSSNIPDELETGGTPPVNRPLFVPSKRTLRE
jgi:type II secretory pathway component GspD/PulD (secretin)